MEVYSQKNIPIFNKTIFYQIGPVIDPKNLQEIMGFLLKIHFPLNLYPLFFKNN